MLRQRKGSLLDLKGDMYDLEIDELYLVWKTLSINENETR